MTAVARIKSLEEVGAFASWQPIYAEHGIATFPVLVNGKDKKPLVKHYQKVGIHGSPELALKYGGAESFGFMLGPRSRITVLDVDTPDERVLMEAFGRHGESPLVIRSGSGNWQGWYRHNGEPRLMKPWPGLPIDLLGRRGFLVAPPSRGSVARYEIVRGTLDDLRHLPALRDLNLPDHAHLVAPAAVNEDDLLLVRGRRNCLLLSACLRHAPQCSDLDQLIDFALRRNEEAMPPMSEAEAIGRAKSYHTSGKNWFVRPVVALAHTTVDELAATDPDAFAMLALLKRWHGARDSFVLAKKTAEKLVWPLRRFIAARDALEAAGEIICLRPGGKGRHDPPVYAWAKGYEYAPQYNKHPFPLPPLEV